MMPGTYQAVYNASKSFVQSFAEALRNELKDTGVSITALMPGPTDTPLARANADMWLTYASDYRGDIGLGPSSPEEQAGALVFLCSPAAARIIGASIMSDAGHAISRLSGSFPPA